ncbi:MAG: hypothetical protein P1V97_16750 [Planctomycetota bacterium]|nr:hypothetical protein [Planctomycetota bacterium]
MNTAKLGERKVVTSVLIWLLGGWIFATAFMMWVAIGNFHVMKPGYLPKAAEVYKAIPEADRALAIKYGANELNRYFFSYYNGIQLGISILCCGLLAASRRPGKIVWGSLILCLGLCLTLEFYFLPIIVDLGREIEFMPRDPMPPEAKRFFMLHGINNLLEIFKGVLLFTATIGLLWPQNPEK